MHADTVGWIDADRLAVKVRRRRDQLPRDDAGFEHLAGAVHVGEKRLERAHPLGDAALDDRPLVGGDDAGHEVEGKRSLLARQAKGDALVAEAAVAGSASLGELVVGEQAECFVQRRVRIAGRVTTAEHLVKREVQLVALEEITHARSLSSRVQYPGRRNDVVMTAKLPRMDQLGVRPATVRDAQAIDRTIEGFAPLERDLHGWVNQADYHLALVEGSDVVGFAARTKHKAHPQRDLAAVYVAPRANRRECEDALYRRVRGKRPLKVRLPAADVEALAVAAAHGFVERIRSATYRVANSLVAGPTTAIGVEDPTRELLDAFAVLYADSHRWDPPSPFTRRYVRQAMLLGAQHMAVVRDDDGQVVGVGAAHASEELSVAADIALVGPLDQDRADADEITRSLLGYLAAQYADDDAPLWFEVDTGDGTNASLARLITPIATADDEVVILTTD